jgi:translation elongation factor EF-1beta
MGKMIVIYKINPKEQEKAEESLELIKKSNFSGELSDAKIDSPGFGIKIIKAAFLLPDKIEGIIDKLTAEITALELIEDAEVEGMNLL